MHVCRLCPATLSATEARDPARPVSLLQRGGPHPLRPQAHTQAPGYRLASGKGHTSGGPQLQGAEATAWFAGSDLELKRLASSLSGY